VKVYRRKINTAMAVVLIVLVKQARLKGVEWLHVPSFIRTIPFPPKFPVGNGGDWSKLRFWDLIEARPGNRDDGSKRNGVYRVTQKGIDFVDRKIVLPISMFVTNQQVLGADYSKQIGIDDALGKNFRYDELMTSTSVVVPAGWRRHPDDPRYLWNGKYGTEAQVKHEDEFRQ
jgi:hypothetical protein